MDQQTPDAASPDRRLLDLVALVLIIVGWGGLGTALFLTHPLLAVAYGSLTVIAAGVALGMSR
ncbi:hypothetical protein ABT352_32775 [Streptosporangium sp. NPDC000563]|uniref:hypothetical protein n=1 Tax=Streptosporangium sp. NPDC000563 TaxID=3154366 RepID=UPI003330D18D